MAATKRYEVLVVGSGEAGCSPIDAASARFPALDLPPHEVSVHGPNPVYDDELKKAARPAGMRVSSRFINQQGATPLLLILHQNELRTLRSLPSRRPRHTR